MIRLDITCERLVGLTTKYMERAISEGEQLAVELHLVLCPDCLTHLDKMRRTARAVALLEGQPIGAERRQDLLRIFAARHGGTA